MNEPPDSRAPTKEQIGPVNLRKSSKYYKNSSPNNIENQKQTDARSTSTTENHEVKTLSKSSESRKFTRNTFNKDESGEQEKANVDPNPKVDAIINNPYEFIGNHFSSIVFLINTFLLFYLIFQLVYFANKIDNVEHKLEQIDNVEHKLEQINQQLLNEQIEQQIDRMK